MEVDAKEVMPLLHHFQMMNTMDKLLLARLHQITTLHFALLHTRQSAGKILWLQSAV